MVRIENNRIHVAGEPEKVFYAVRLTHTHQAKGVWQHWVGDGLGAQLCTQ
jgi:hypothetical protein